MDGQETGTPTHDLALGGSASRGGEWMRFARGAQTCFRVPPDEAGAMRGARGAGRCVWRERDSNLQRHIARGKVDVAGQDDVVVVCVPVAIGKHLWSLYGRAASVWGGVRHRRDGLLLQHTS